MDLTASVTNITQDSAVLKISCTSDTLIHDVTVYVNDVIFTSFHPVSNIFSDDIALDSLTPYNEYEISITAVDNEDDDSTGVYFETLPIFVEKVKAQNIECNVDEYTDIITEVLPLNASNKSLMYECESEAVSFSGDSFVATKPGQYIITAGATDGSETTTDITVTVNRYAVDFSVPVLENRTLTISKEVAVPLVIAFEPPNASNRGDVSFSSRNGLVSFNGYELVTACEQLRDDTLIVKCGTVVKEYPVKIVNTSFVWNEFDKEQQTLGVPEFGLLNENAYFLSTFSPTFSFGATGSLFPAYNGSFISAIENVDREIAAIIKSFQDYDNIDLSIYWAGAETDETITRPPREIYNKWIEFFYSAKEKLEEVYRPALCDIDGNTIVDENGNTIRVLPKE